VTRREAIGLMASTPPAPQPRSPEIDPAIVSRHDRALDSLLQRQITDPASPRSGAYPDEFGLYAPGAASGILEWAMAAFFCRQSKFHRAAELAARMRLAAGYLDRVQNEHGNVDLPITNFNSPPDTAFVSLNVATSCLLARRAGERELVSMLEPFLRKAGAAMAAGGIHTPNHRWVVCAALAQLHELFPDERYPRRAGQWLAEGIDIDSDGQYTERSTLVYNPITNRALIIVAEKLNRLELLGPVRQNLESMLYLLHPGDELVTEISRRQDQYQRGGAGRHWFALKYLGVRDRDGRFNGLANKHAAESASLSAMMEYPLLTEPGPTPAAIPEDYEKALPALNIARIRRGPASATVILAGNSRFFTLRHGQAVITAVRMAAAFFGKGQFVPFTGERSGSRYVLKQRLSAPYYQPLDPPQPVHPEDWARWRPLRRQSEICWLDYHAAIEETASGFHLELRAEGAAGVPLAIEINLGGSGSLSGCAPAPAGHGSFLLEDEFATYREGNDAIRFGPRLCEHAYTQVRGAEPKLPGRSVYLTAYTPLNHILRLEWV
jgi:hypothetical protein